MSNVPRPVIVPSALRMRSGDSVPMPPRMSSTPTRQEIGLIPAALRKIVRASVDASSMIRREMLPLSMANTADNRAPARGLVERCAGRLHQDPAINPTEQRQITGCEQLAQRLNVHAGHVDIRRYAAAIRVAGARHGLDLPARPEQRPEIAQGEHVDCDAARFERAAERHVRAADPGVGEFVRRTLAAISVSGARSTVSGTSASATGDFFLAASRTFASRWSKARSTERSSGLPCGALDKLHVGRRDRVFVERARLPGSGARVARHARMVQRAGATRRSRRMRRQSVKSPRRWALPARAALSHHQRPSGSVIVPWKCSVVSPEVT